MNFGLGTTAQMLLFSVGPSLFHVAVWAAVAAFAARRNSLNTPGALPILLAAACSILSLLLNMVWSVLFLLDQNGAMGFLEHPIVSLVNYVVWAGGFFTPPLFLWGLWLTWRGYDRQTEPL